jgi:hypothetical protein
MHTIQYASSRQEVWRWYWKAWARPKGLWLFHVVIAFTLAVTITRSGLGSPFRADQFAVAFFACLLLCLLLLPLWPQIKFKPSVRTLAIDESGLSTSIGKLSATRTWKEIATIEDNGKEIVIVGRNRNAFIVPMRAFQTDKAREEFLRDATFWHSKSAI